MSKESKLLYKLPEPAPDDASQEDEGPKSSIVSANAKTVGEYVQVSRFRGRPMVLVLKPYPHYTPLHREAFDRIAYPILGGVSRSRMSDVFAYLGNTAQDLTANEGRILFGVAVADVVIEADTDLEHFVKNKPRVWSSDDLSWEPIGSEDQCIWRSPYAPMPVTAPIPFIMSLAGGSQGKYDDIMQSLAPLVMTKKPDGVMWWIGDGANGKSTLMDALYKIFPGQLSSINVKRLTDGRDTPSLNGTLANIVKESSEGRIEDTEIYKSIGTHENFRVHKFHSQDDIEIRGNLHHIFSANSIPSFNDKGYSARRRTFIIPFTERFDSDPNFEEKTFTPTMFGQLITEMCNYAQRIKDQGYRFKWSADTLAAKGEYDTDANNAEEYVKELIDGGVVAFDSYNPINIDYQNWCADNGYVPLGITNLRRAIGNVGFNRSSQRVNGVTKNIYILPNTPATELQATGMIRPGLYTLEGFERLEDVKPTVPQFTEATPVEKPKSTVLNDKW